MPFTLAHPVAALPLRGLMGGLGSAPALVIGSLTPDLVYFLPLTVTGWQSHSLAGLLWFSMPAGLIVWTAYRLVLRPFVAAILPEALSRRLREPVPRNWRAADVLAAAASVVVGAGTHLAWDSFTHSSGAAVRALPALQAQVSLASFYTPRVFTVLQHLSSVVGLLVLMALGARWYRRTVPGQANSGALPFWSRLSIVLFLVVPSTAVGIAVLVSHLDAGDGSVRMQQLSVGRAVVSAGTVFLPSFMVAALAWCVARRRRFHE
jgi:hypothetical protein